MRFLASSHIPFMLLVFFVNNFLIGLSPFVRHEFVLLIEMTNSDQHRNKVIIRDIKCLYHTFMIESVHRR